MSLGKQRIQSLSDNGRVHATIAFAPGDGPVTLHGYSRAPVSASAIGSTVSQATYNNTTHRFSLRRTRTRTRTRTATVTLTRPN